MDLSQQYVYRVYLEKSFTLAANALYVSQPALSAMISKHEKKKSIDKRIGWGMFAVFRIGDGGV